MIEGVLDFVVLKLLPCVFFLLLFVAFFAVGSYLSDNSEYTIEIVGTDHVFQGCKRSLVGFTDANGRSIVLGKDQSYVVIKEASE